jgi:hypothetical protein
MLVEMRGSTMSPLMATPRAGHHSEMCVAADAGPVVLADAHLHAVHQAPERARHGRHHARVVARAAADLLQRRLVDQPVRAEERRRRLAAEAGGALRRHPRGVVVGRADPQPARMLGRAPALAQPVRQPDVVRVHVRDDDAQDRQAVERGREHLLPLRLRFVAGDAAVDHRPALAAVEAVAQQPEVDVVEGEGQRHAHPAHAGSDLEGGAGGRERVAEGVLQFGFLRIHAGGLAQLTLTSTSTLIGAF